MIGSLLFLALQAATAQPAMVSAVDAPTEQESTGASTETVAPAAAPAQPPRKRVCRTVVDTRTGIMGKRSKVCRFVDEES